MATTSLRGRPPRRRRSLYTGERRLAAAMITPTLALMAVVAAYPIGYAIWLSLHQYSRTTAGASRWVGFENYTAALFGDTSGFAAAAGIASGDFWSAFLHTVVFAVISVSAELTLGLVMALIMHQAFKGRGLLRATILVPYAVLTIVSAIVWQTVTAPDSGFVPQVLSAFGLPGADRVRLASTPDAMAVVIIADIWKTAPFMALMLLAGLQVIPGDLYEAARVDGATKWQQFRRITLPLLRPAIAVALIFRTLDALRVFDLPWVLTGGQYGTSTLSTEAYSTFSGDQLIGSGAALSVITFVVVMAVSLIYIRFVGGNLRDATSENT
ncbi:carbohydrate ABC transporter permease [Patulibacter americanus]|uniref:carbohydrate ABC transporter permease n=1 Tax=Patulibacter americanus TaxID=588672 RepID=UPI0003B3AF99|nr:sugar ABC transporter permease [Patulibacter americanus]